LPIKQGSSYRVRLRVKSSEAKSMINLALATFENGKGYWQTTGKGVVVTPEWKTVEVSGRMLKAGEAQWKEWMKTFWLRIDCRADKGRIFVDDVVITEAASMDEFSAWQEAGWDTHSIVADPMFVDAEHDDFNLKPESPAIQKLGFKPLPLGEMGLMIDEWRKAK
jgi:hypothetical protein